MHFVKSNNLSLKHQRFTLSGYKDIGVRILEVVAKTQFLLCGNSRFSKVRLSRRIRTFILFSLIWKIR